MELTTNRIPGPLKIDGYIFESYKFFKQQFEIYMVSTEKSKKSEKVKTAILLRYLGPQAIKIFNTFDFANNTEKENLANEMEKFEKFCIPKKNFFL